MLFTKPKEEQLSDFKGMEKMMQKLSNKIMDLEKDKETHKFYKLYYKKREDNNQPQPPPHGPASMNLTEVGWITFALSINNPILKKNCPQWINSMTLVMNQLLDSKLIEDNNE